MDTKVFSVVFHYVKKKKITFPYWMHFQPLIYADLPAAIQKDICCVQCGQSLHLARRLSICRENSFSFTWSKVVIDTRYPRDPYAEEQFLLNDKQKKTAGTSEAGECNFIKNQGSCASVWHLLTVS